MVLTEHDKIYNWITMSESGISKVLTEDDWQGARDYYEDEQAPEDVPDDKDYLQVDIITDAIDRSVGQVVSGDIKVTIKGGGQMAKPIKELYDDIFEANDFYDITLPDQLNKFYCEGMGMFKLVDNPFKESRYGLGFLEIHGIQVGRGLLDTNSRTGMHNDDTYRIHKERRKLSYALDKWGKTKSGKRNKLYNEIKGAVAEQEGSDTEEWVDVYEIEYKETQFYTDDDGLRREKDVWYICKVINKTVMVEKPQKTGYTYCRMQPMIHTPRVSVDVGRYPMGLFKKIKQQQDNINITESVILDSVKASIKNFFFGKGIKPEEALNIKKEVAQIDGFAYSTNPNAKLEHFGGQPISPGLVQLRGMLHEDKDMITGSSSQATQFQAASSGQLSGKAIGSLQFAGILPEYAKKTNIEYALKQIGLIVMEYIGKKMQQPFEIQRPIEGKERIIRFNKMAEPGYEGDEYEVVKDGVINPLSNLPKMDLVVEIEMNAAQRRELEMNKAIMMAQMGKISDVDLMEAMYPYTWKEKIENLKKQSTAQAIIQEAVEMGGEELLQTLGQTLEGFKEMFKDGKFVGDEEQLSALMAQGVNQ